MEKKIVKHRKVESAAWSKYDRKQIMEYIRQGKSDHEIARLMGCGSHVSIAKFRYSRGIVANHTDVTGFKLSVSGLKRRQEADLKRHREYMKSRNKK